MESYKLHNTSLYSTIHLSLLSSLLKNKQTAVCLKTRKSQYFSVSSDSYFSRDAIMQLRPVSPAGVLWVGEAFVTFCGSYWKTSLVKFCFTGEEKASYRKHDICVGISERKKNIRWGIVWIFSAWIYKHRKIRGLFLFHGVFINITYIYLKSII